MVSGWLFLLIGLAIILHLQAAAGFRLILATVWMAATHRDFRRQARGHARVHRLRLDPRGGTISHTIAGKEQTIQLLGGSIVLRHWACLRLGFDDGLSYVEFFMSRDYSASTWRRLQLFWRHGIWRRRAMVSAAQDPDDA